LAEKVLRLKKNQTKRKIKNKNKTKTKREDTKMGRRHHNLLSI